MPTRYSLLHPGDDVSVVMDLRREVYIEEEGRPEASLFADSDVHEHHVAVLRDGLPLGCATYAFPAALSGCARIGKVVLRREARGATVGLTLMCIALEAAMGVEARPRRVLAAVYRERASMLRIYDRLGFRVVAGAGRCGKTDVELRTPAGLGELRCRLFARYRPLIDDIDASHLRVTCVPSELSNRWSVGASHQRVL